MNYELCKKLKDIGFPQKSGKDYPVFWYMTSGSLFLDSHEKAGGDYVYVPTISDLILELGNDFDLLTKEKGLTFRWLASGNVMRGFVGEGATSEEALSNLYIELK